MTQPQRIGETSSLQDQIPLEGEEVGIIETKFGKIVIRFFADVAPGHVANFKKLAGDKFYDGTTFHRVIPRFMIQGGDPNSKSPDKSRHGMGGPGYEIKAEFNSVKHVRGVCSMARSSDPNSAGSQFFIMHQAYPSLDGQYTVWGRVVKTGKERAGEEAEGLKVVDQIVNAPRDRNDNPNDRIEMTVKVAKWPL